MQRLMLTLAACLLLASCSSTPDAPPSPPPSNEDLFLSDIESAGLTMDDDRALALGRDLCGALERSGPSTAEAYGQSQVGASGESVRSLVVASARFLCPDQAPQLIG